VNNFAAIPVVANDLFFLDTGIVSPIYQSVNRASRQKLKKSQKNTFFSDVRPANGDKLLSSPFTFRQALVREMPGF